MNKATSITDVSARANASALTVDAWGEQWMEMKAARGHRSSTTDRYRWRAHVSRDPIAAMPLASVRRADAVAWFHRMLTRKSQTPRVRSERKPISAQTCKNILNLVRCAFEDAVLSELVEYNHFRTLRVPRSRSATTMQKWQVLQPDEQLRLLQTIPEPEKWLVAFALGTGIRQGETHALRVSDVVLAKPNTAPYVVIRYGGTDDRPTKGGQPRIVPLFGLGLLAAKKQIEHLEKERARFATFESKEATRKRLARQLLFPGDRGGTRGRRAPRGWKTWIRTAGIRRNIRWHDLRHTCAASLVSGWYGGRQWSLEEVKELLGHSSIAVTERYAHFAKNVLLRAADATDPDRRRLDLPDVPVAALSAWIALEHIEEGAVGRD